MPEMMEVKNRTKGLLTVLFICVLFLGSSCTGESRWDRVEKARKRAAEARKNIDPVEAEIKSLRNADFDYIYLVRRKDGEKMDSDDKTFIKNNDHPTTNRRTLSKDEKIVFLGSNFAFPEAGLTNLKDRFDIEDLSKSKEELENQKKKREEALEQEKLKNRLDKNTPKKSDRSRFDPATNENTSDEPVK